MWRHHSLLLPRRDENTHRRGRAVSITSLKRHTKRLYLANVEYLISLRYRRIRGKRAVGKPISVSLLNVVCV